MSGLSRSFKWFYHEFGIASIHATGRNAYLIILARTCRMFAYGTNTLILAIFFAALDFSDHQIGLFMTLTLLGDVFLGTFLTLVADRVGRRRVLMFGSLLMMLSGVVFAVFENFWILLGAAIVGVISVTGGDFGPFRSIEESMLSQLTTPSTRSDILAWYVTTSTFGSSIGSEASGRIIYALQSREGWTAVDAYHALFWIYTVMGVINVLLVLPLTEDCELPSSDDSYIQISQNENDRDETTENQQNVGTAPGISTNTSWIRRTATWLSTRLAQISAPTRSVMYKLWILLAMDSIADGMVPFSMVNYFMDIKFHPLKSTLGDVTSVSYFLGAVSAIFAGPLARKIGLINTMVFTHVPSSAAVVLFPFPPHFWMAVGLLLLRAGLNNMDQAPRTAFIAAVVKPEERTAVMGITSMLRTLAAMTGPTITGLLAAGDKFWIAFVVAGSCRLAYDFGLYALFVNTKLHQHETKLGEEDVPRVRHTRREPDEEEAVDLQENSPSVSDSNSGEDDDSVVEEPVVTRRGLNIPRTNESVRSRSPHRLADR